MKLKAQLPVLVLAVVALLIRLPFRSQYLYHWDSVNFALSLAKFDVRLHQPHPPGYILYSMLGRLINLFFQDPNASLVWLSLISGVLGVISIYYCGLILFNAKVGLLAALIVTTNPLHWFYSDVALSYSLEFALVPLLIILSFRQLTKNSPSSLNWLFFCLVFGILGGVRQNDLVFLAPIFFLSLISLSWKKRILSCLVTTVVVLAWLIPMVMLSGGLAGYLGALRGGTDVVMTESSLYSLTEILLNGGRLVIYALYGLLLAALFLPVGLFLIIPKIKTVMRQPLTWLFSLWILPALFFYVFIHIRQPGHIFIILPGLILCSALCIDWVGKKLNSPKFSTAVIAGFTAANIAFFYFSPPSLFGSNQLPLQTPSRQTIQQRDLFLAERINYIRDNFAPETTVILAGGLNFRHPDYYFPNYQMPDISYTRSSHAIDLPPAITTLILFDDQILSTLPAEEAIKTVKLQTSGDLRFIQIAPPQHFLINAGQVLINGK